MAVDLNFTSFLTRPFYLATPFLIAGMFWFKFQVFEKLLFVLAKGKQLSAYLVQLVDSTLLQQFNSFVCTFCVYFLCMLAFSYHAGSLGQCTPDFS